MKRHRTGEPYISRIRKNKRNRKNSSERFCMFLSKSLENVENYTCHAMVTALGNISVCIFYSRFVRKSICFCIKTSRIVSHSFASPFSLLFPFLVFSLVPVVIGQMWVWTARLNKLFNESVMQLILISSQFSCTFFAGRNFCFWQSSHCRHHQRRNFEL